MCPFRNATAIWNNHIHEVNTYCAFQDWFSLDKLPLEACLHISVQNRYAVYINGHLLPAQSCADYPFRRYYDSLQIPVHYLHIGDNNLSILAYCQNEDSFIIRAGDGAELIYSLQADGVELVNSSTQTLCSAVTGFRCGKQVEKISPQISYTAHYDATICDEWYKEDQRSNLIWKQSVPVNKASEYFPRPIPQMLWAKPAVGTIVAQGLFQDPVNAKLAADRIALGWLSARRLDQISTPANVHLPTEEGIHFQCNESADGIYVIIDMRKNVAGYLQLDIDTPESCLIDIGYGEHLEDLRVRANIGGRNFAITYQSKAGNNSFHYTIKRLAGRYIQLHVHSTTFTLRYVGLQPTNYPLSINPAPLGLNDLQKKIYDVGIHTLRLCMHEHYEDTPWREQALYALDSRNQILCGYDAFGEYTLPRESIQLLALGMRQDGLLELCAPAKMDPLIPSFSLFWIVELSEYVERSQDLAFARAMLPTALQILQTFRKGDSYGLIQNLEGYWNFFEWTDFLNGLNEAKDEQITRPGTEAPINAVYALALLKLIKMAQMLQDHTLIDQLRAEHRAIKEAYHTTFWCEEKQGYALGLDETLNKFCPELLQALSIYAKLCPDSKTEDTLYHKIITEQYLPQCSLSTAMFKYEVLLDRPQYYELMLRQVSHEWGSMVYQGATSFWETNLGADDFYFAGSLCHGWSAIPVYVYQTLSKKGYFDSMGISAQVNAGCTI